MEEYKILQIIPNFDKELIVKNYHELLDEKEIDYVKELKIICFALVEYKNEEREIEPMVLSPDGKMVIAKRVKGYDGIKGWGLI